MNKELEEAIRTCKKLITTKFNNDYSIDNIDKEAIETVLNYIENSIPKEKIEEKIEEVVNLIEDKQFKIIMGDTTVCNRIKYILKEELLEGK